MVRVELEYVQKTEEGKVKQGRTPRNKEGGEKKLASLGTALVEVVSQEEE